MTVDPFELVAAVVLVALSLFLGVYPAMYVALMFAALLTIKHYTRKKDRT